MVFNIEKDNINANNLWDSDEKERRVAQLYEKSKSYELRNLEELLASAKNTDAVEKIIESLFPNLSQLFEQKRSNGKTIVGGSPPIGRQWSRDRRLCSPRRFARYFASSIPSTSLNQQEREKLASLTSDRLRLVEAIEEYADKGQTDDVLEELELIARSELKTGEVEPFITALMDWGDTIYIPRWSKSSVPTRSFRLCSILLLALNKTSDLESAVDIFVEASANTTGFYLPLLCAEHNFRIGDEAYFTLQLVALPEEQRQEVNARLVEKLKQAAKDVWSRFEEEVVSEQSSAKPLQERSVFGPLLWRWILRDSPQPVFGTGVDETPQSDVDWPSREKARSWVERLISTPRGYAQFAQMVAFGTTNIWGDEPSFPNVMQFFSSNSSSTR